MTTHPTAVEFINYNLSSGMMFPLKDISFSLGYGESLAVVGRVGSGKSILLSVVSQSIWNLFQNSSDFSQSGTCCILGYNVTPRRPSLPTLEILSSRIAVVGERTSWLPVSVAENFLLAERIAGHSKPRGYFEILEDLPLSQRNRAQISALAELLPSQVELPLLQQLGIIRALLRNPALLILDEPFLRMDNVLLRQTESLIMNWASSTTIIWATNDLHQASRVSDYTLLLMQGKVKEFTPTPQFFTNPKTEEAENFIAGRPDDID